MRELSNVIEAMLEKIPEENGLYSTLMSNLESTKFAPPEMIKHFWWSEVHSNLMEAINIPKEDWEFNVLSIFSTKSVEELREYFQNIS
jgi:hypothetical protein